MKGGFSQLFTKRLNSVPNRISRTTFRGKSAATTEFGKFRVALTRRIDPSLEKNALRLPKEKSDVICMKTALAQHASLLTAMKRAGMEVVELPSDSLPDSVFVEDTVVAVDKVAMITNPGAFSRREETVAIKAYLETSLSTTLRVVQQVEGTLDGGDVLFTGKEFFVGHSQRTNTAGIQFLAKTFPQYRITPISINLFSSSILHLKSACSMCGPDHVLVGGELGQFIAESIEAASPAVYRITHIPDAEAANCVYANGILFRRTREEFPDSADVLDSLGGEQIQIEASELAKVDAALTCCSVLI